MAAARLLQRRLTSFLCQGRSYFPASEEASVCLLRKQFASLFCQDWSQFSIPQGLTHASQITIGIRGIHTHIKSVDTADDDAENTKNCTDDPKVPASSSEMPNFICSESNVKYTALSNLKTSTRHDLAMIFTCRVCETRSVKTVCRESYEKGVVVARCGGCNNFHLIADRLGWFGEPGTVEDLLAARGEEVRRGSVDTLNLTLEDLVGTGAKSS